MSSNPQQLMSSPPSPMVWFLLVESDTGLPYKGTSADKVAVSSPADVADFRKAVKAEYNEPNYLRDIPSSALLVYKNKYSFDKRNTAVEEGKEDPLKSSRSLNGLGKTEEDALIVAVPSSRNSDQSSSESSLARKEPNPKRKQRWIALNEVLEGNAKKSKTIDSTGYCYVSWNEVKTVFNPTNYVQ
ncbi:hypothetical protein BC833DRAFT_454794, partial [Globomyces pollinis-pini]